jgi:hypothetical protein
MLAEILRNAVVRKCCISAHIHQRRLTKEVYRNKRTMLNLGDPLVKLLLLLLRAVTRDLQRGQFNVAV